MDVSTTISAELPAGAVLDYAGPSAPAGFLMCDGSAISRSAYPRLFEKIGTYWGVGDGSTTFNLPNLCGRTTIGMGEGVGLTARTLGQSGGAETHVLTTTEMPSHTHTQNAHSHSITDPGHTHNVSTNFATTGSGSTIATVGGINPAAIGSSTTGISIQNATATNQSTGGNAAHNNMQPFAVLNKIIKY